jgi:hypothetical protein
MDGHLPTHTQGATSGPTPTAPPPAPSTVKFGEGAFGGASTVATAPLRPPTGRFAPLSALPPDKRLPPRRDTYEAQRQQEQAQAQQALAPTAPPAIAPRERPGTAHANPARQLMSVKQIGFNCPSCLAILIIKQPENYDGQAAPCPNCAVVILPPRIAPTTPFALSAGQLPGFPQ